jgi:hypothetical protein
MVEKSHVKVHCAVCDEDVDPKSEFVWSLGICASCLRLWGLEDLQSKMRIVLP